MYEVSLALPYWDASKEDTPTAFPSGKSGGFPNGLLQLSKSSSPRTAGMQA